MVKQEHFIEKGIIKDIHGNRAIVQLVRQNTSEGCYSCGVCGDTDVKKNPPVLEVETIPHLFVGQMVKLQKTVNSPYKAIILTFITPLISLFIGSFVGQKIEFIFPKSQDIRMFICGFVFFLLAIFAVSIYDKKTRHKNRKHHKIISCDNHNI